MTAEHEGVIAAWGRAAGRPLRLALAETWDPDGAMYGWLSADAATHGVDVLTMPTQEALGLVGPHALAAAWRSVAQSFRPDLVLVHPPYDHLDRATIDALRAEGAVVCAFAFDEPLFAVARQRPSVSDAFIAMARAFDAYFVTGNEDAASLAAHGVDAAVTRFCTSAPPFAERMPVPPLLRPIDTPIHDAVVLVGRPYARRIALVSFLANAGVPVHVYGHGWTDEAVHPQLPSGVGIGPPLQRGAMNMALATAGVVLTTGDWEQVAVPMVKYRILEAAMLGAPQVVQASVDLARYFGADEVAAFDSDAACLAACRALLADRASSRAMATRARTRTLREHGAITRLGELVTALGLDPQTASRAPSLGPGAAWELLAATIAHDAERRGATRLAAEAYRRLLDATDSPDGAAGLDRVALATKILADSVEAIAPATGQGTWQTSAVGLHAQVGSLPGPGLGHMAFLDPAAERHAVAFALDPAGFDWEARGVEGDADTLIVMASLLELPEQLSAATRAAWVRLFHAALAAVPVQTAHLTAAHAERWRDHLARC